MNVRDSLRYLLSPVPEPGPAIPSTDDWRTASAVVAKQERLAARTLDSFTEFPDWTQQTLAAFGLHTRPWRFPSVAQALEVPAIWRSVTLIANTVGSLSVETFRNGVKIDSPQVVSRPDPFRTGQKFYRDTAQFMAAYGEAWWWVAKRDTDGLPMSLIVVPGYEVVVDATIDRLRPKLTWNHNGKSTDMDPRDFRQLTLYTDPSTLRGLGPLQACGAAVSVAVESQAWAANFYAEGGYPSVLIKAAGKLGDNPDDPDNADALTEAELLRDQWRSKDHNTARVIDEGIESVTEFGVNEQGAQMLEARLMNRGDTANMFGIPGVLLEYNSPGSSLTYQSIPDVFALFVKACLGPNYLEPIEQELSDLLPRATTGRFNVSGFERADAKSRWETYAIMATVLGQQEAADVARTSEGLAPGDIEYAPVPFAPPSAFPTALPVNRSADPVRCDGRIVVKGIARPCRKLLAEAGPFVGRCERCGKDVDTATIAVA